jgi:ribose 5-phosphate isomerase A
MAPPRTTGRRTPALKADQAVEREKRAAAQAAAELVSDGMRVGLGTGTTAALLVSALAERELRELVCVATSPATERLAGELGLTIADLDDVGELDIAIDGADQVDPRGWLIKGGGAAHTREKIVAAAARTFVVIVSQNKAVAELQPPVPLEIVPFGAHATLARVGHARLREGTPPSPDGGLIADYTGPIVDPRELAARLSAVPGLVEHGLFPPEMVDLVLLGRDTDVEERTGSRRRKP